MQIPNNTMYATMDPKLVEYNALNNNNCKIIFIGDTTGYDDMIRYYHILTASPLVPDYTVMEADIEGTLLEFQTKYATYLQSSAAMQYFITMLTALHLGRQILLFFPPECKGLKYPLELLNHIANAYGITVGFPEYGISFSYDTRFDPRNATLMYMYNLIPVEEYLLFAGTGPIDYNKVITDLRLFGNQNCTMNDFVIFIDRYRNNILQAGKPLVRPINMEVPHHVNSIGTKDTQRSYSGK